MCTDDLCDPAAGCGHADNTAPCDDGNACTTTDTCANGSCASTGPASFSAGGGHVCALRTNGRIECWGDNSYGQLGNGSQGYSSEPILVPSVTGVERIATADAATCALGDDDVVRCWGRNRDGQIGNGSGGVGLVVLSPSVVQGLSGALDDVDSGLAHSCALTASEQVFCWGNNTFGQIGDGSVNTDRFTATEVQL